MSESSHGPATIDAVHHDPGWWRDAVVYQIYPRSFADADDDGVGDLAGLTARLDHLAELRVDAVWLSPIFRSPMADFGYDVADYCDVDPVFGDLADLDRLVAEAHDRGIRVLLDWVPNHTSDQHPWFLDALTGRDAEHRDWYVWRDPAPDGGPPNNWGAAFEEGRPAWTLDEESGQYYLHLFLPEQPDLDWTNPAVVEAMHDTLRFWLDRGVDGFRADVVHLIGKGPELADLPPDQAGTSPVTHIDDERTHAILRDIRAVLDGYDHEPIMVGEVYLLDPEQLARYHSTGDELHLAFNFKALHTDWVAADWRRRITEMHDVLGAGWPTWVLSNHDQPRHRTRYGSEARARAAAVLLLTLRGTPFLYAGEELGLTDAEVPPDRAVDPGGRDGCRAPIPWLVEPPHGWGPDPWLPFPPHPGERSAEAEAGDPGSMLGLYRRLLRARRNSPALRSGTERLLDGPTDVIVRERERDGDRRIVAVNFSSDAVEVALDGTVEVSSDGRNEGAPFDGTLGPDQAVILGP